MHTSGILKGTRRWALTVGLATICSLLLLWELSGALNLYNARLLPPPSSIGRAFIEMNQTGEWLGDIRDSVARYSLGFLLGAAAGILLGIGTARAKVLQASLAPILNYVRSTPLIALVPLFIVLFGIGLEQKVILVAWGVMFPVWLNTQIGIAETETEYIWTAQSLGISGWRLYREVFLPRSVPFIIGGIRTAISTGFFALGAAEIAGTFSGIVFRVYYSYQMFRTDKMMVAILSIGLLGIAFDQAYLFTMRRLVPWWKGA